MKRVGYLNNRSSSITASDRTSTLPSFNKIRDVSPNFCSALESNVLAIGEDSEQKYKELRTLSRLKTNLTVRLQNAQSPSKNKIVFLESN